MWLAVRAARMGIPGAGGVRALGARVGRTGLAPWLLPSRWPPGLLLIRRRRPAWRLLRRLVPSRRLVLLRSLPPCRQARASGLLRVGIL